MKHVYPVRHPPVPPAARRGETTPARQDTPGAPPMPPDAQDSAEPAPLLPHEHDESSHSQASRSAAHGAIGRQAHEDAQGPTEDTDRGPVADATYRRLVKPDPSR